MMDKKSGSVKERNKSIIQLENNFITFIGERCNEFNIPVPKFIVCSNEKKRTVLSPTSTQISHDIEINLHRVDTHTEISLKLKYKGCKFSGFILDTIFLTINKFNIVTSLNLSNCHITADEIEKIAMKLNETGCINDINLDNNPNSCGNHYLLCSGSGHLKYLSLKFCKLGDLGIEKLANALKYQDDTEDNIVLVQLNLAHNQITDVGATFIAKQMLHTNRSIQSLNLNGNLITDRGAVSILSELYMFPLTHMEIVELRKRKYARLMQQEKPEVYNLSAVNALGDEKERVIQIDCHPFMNETYEIKGAIMSTGNLVLQHLNLSYNHLTSKTLKEIVKCIYYHSYMMLNDSSRGLLHINLKGNDVAEDDEIWTQLQDLLNHRYDNKENESEKYEALVPVESKILRNQMNLQSVKK